MILDPLEDPDYTLIVRVQDMGGASEMALSGNTRVHISVRQNLWVNPGPVTVKENLKETYPLAIAKVWWDAHPGSTQIYNRSLYLLYPVTDHPTLASFLPSLIQVQSNEPNAIYRLTQKERELKFPFQITEDGEIYLTEELDREDRAMVRNMCFACSIHLLYLMRNSTLLLQIILKPVSVWFQYTLVVIATDNDGQEVDPPMEIQVLVEDENDNKPMCENDESVFEVQEGEPIGKMCV